MDRFTALGKDIDVNCSVHPLSTFPILYDQRSTFEDGLGGIRGVFPDTVIVSERV